MRFSHNRVEVRDGARRGDNVPWRAFWFAADSRPRPPRLGERSHHEGKSHICRSRFPQLLILMKPHPGCTMFKPPPNMSSTGWTDRGEGQKIRRAIPCGIKFSGCQRMRRARDVAACRRLRTIPSIAAATCDSVSDSQHCSGQGLAVQAATTMAAPGLKVTTLAEGLDHPRWLYVLPNGNILVAETKFASQAGGP